MFEQTLIMNRGNRLWSTGAGLASQAMLVGLAILAPLVLPQSGLQLSTLTHLVFPGAPPPPPPPGPVVQPHQARASLRIYDAKGFFAPTSAPAHPVMLVDEPDEIAPAGIATGGVPAGMDGGVPGSIINSVLSHVTVPPPQPAPATVAVVRPPEPPPAPPRIRVGTIETARLISRIEPTYPEIAKRARISGVVELETVIGTDGHIREVRVLSGHPLLVQAALSAVRQWIYRPTLLNGVAVEVQGPVIVTFRLN
jgi:protein TonB